MYVSFGGQGIYFFFFNSSNRRVRSSKSTSSFVSVFGVLPKSGRVLEGTAGKSGNRSSPVFGLLGWLMINPIGAGG